MLLQHPFEVITTAVDGGVVQVLAGADTWFTVTQTWKLSEVRSRDQVRKVLARLAATGILDVEQVATSYRYRLNRDHLSAAAIIDIADTRQRLLDRLRSELDVWSGLIYAALFGSAARGDMHPGSDIDILLVRTDTFLFDDIGEDAWEADILAFEHKVSRWTGNPTNILHMRESEVQRSGNVAALANIRREGISLHGDQAWLAKALTQAGITR